MSPGSEEQSQDPFKDALSKFKTKSIGQRSKSVAEIQGPFDNFAMTTRKRLDAAIKKATNTRNVHRQELLTRLEEITEELMELDNEYTERHRKFEDKIQIHLAMF